MASEEETQWVIREETSPAVVLALYLRQALGLRSHHDVPNLRDAPVVEPARWEKQQHELEKQWQQFWDMTVEPLAHTGAGPLELVDGYDTLLALPTNGTDELRDEIVPLADAAMAYATESTRKHNDAMSRMGEEGKRPYINAISARAHDTGRPARPFELNIHILPLTQRGIWWIGSLSVAVTDTLRTDRVAYDSAIAPIIAELG